MTRKQLVLAFVVISALQWLLLGCAAPGADRPQPHVCLKVVGTPGEDVTYTASLEL